MNLSIFESYTLDPDEIGESANFASNCTNNYGKRGQTNQKKIELDIWHGKMGELIAYYKLRDHLCELTYPSFEILPPGQKGWQADMTAGGLEIAVKTCTKHSSPSWVFQYSDTAGHGRDNAIFGNAEDKLLVFVMLNHPLHENADLLQPISGNIVSLATLQTVKDCELFWEPRKGDLRGAKQVVYYNGLMLNGMGRQKIHPSIEALIEKVQA